MAHLRYVDSSEPGLSRRRCGRGFSYRWPDGSTVRDAAVRARIAALAIPPAWTDVWICADDRGHILATGRDARDRKQYIYHPRWIESQSAAKFESLVAFGEALPRIRRRVRRDLRRPGLPRPKVLAAVVRLLDQTYLRIGNEAYTAENDSYGLTTLRERHVEVDGSTIQIDFDGKGGQHRTVALDDGRIAAVVSALQDLPGQRLFQYLDEEGASHVVESTDVNDYLRDASGADVTAKDYRTWAATVTAAAVLQAIGEGERVEDRTRSVREALDQVAGLLGNTAAICRSAYVDPRLVEAYLEGRLCDALGELRAGSRDARIPDLLAEEAVVLAYLRDAG